MKSRTLLVRTAFVLVPVAAIWLYLLWYAPPLWKTKKFSASYFISGKSHTDAQVFQPVGFPSRCYISIPSPSVPDYYRWFVVDFSRHIVALPSFGVTCPCGSPCIHRYQEIGLVIPDMDKKIGDDVWNVAVNANSAEFSNGTLSVSLTQNR